MSARSLFNERFGMLMACASPGSAMAYHLGAANSKSDLVQRSRAQVARASAARDDRGWLARAFDRLEQWSWERQLRAQEAYLSEATDLCDLEARIRHLDNPDASSRARVLR